MKYIHRFFYKNSFYKNHQAQSCQKIKNILRIMARLKYMINSLESPILILHQESALFTMECLLFTMEGLQFRKNLCSKSTHKSIKTQLIEHRIEWKAILCYKKVDFLFCILCNLGKFKRNYEYNLSLIYKALI